MTLFPCAACPEKAETIGILKEQLAASQAREEVLQKANLALVDARAHAQVWRKPRPEEVRSKPAVEPSPWEAANYVPQKPLSREEIEAAFREPAGVAAAGFVGPRSA